MLHGISFAPPASRQPERPPISLSGYRHGRFSYPNWQMGGCAFASRPHQSTCGWFADDRIHGALLAGQAWLAGGEFDWANAFVERAVAAASHSEISRCSLARYSLGRNGETQQDSRNSTAGTCKGR